MGGAIFVNAGSLTINNVEFVTNTAMGAVGAVPIAVLPPEAARARAVRAALFCLQVRPTVMAAAAQTLARVEARVRAALTTVPEPAQAEVTAVAAPSEAAAPAAWPLVQLEDSAVVVAAGRREAPEARLQVAAEHCPAAEAPASAVPSSCEAAR